MKFHQVFLWMLVCATPMISTLLISQDTTDESDNRIEKSFKVPVHFLQLIENPTSKNLEPFVSEKTPSSLEKNNQSMNFMGQFGVRLNSNDTALFSPEKGTLVVKTSGEQMKLIEKAIQTLPKFTLEEEREFVSDIVATTITPTEDHEDSNCKKLREGIEAKLTTIRIPEVHIVKETLPKTLKAIEQLAAEFDTWEIDPSKKGVTLIYYPPHRQSTQKSIEDQFITSQFKNCTVEEILNETLPKLHLEYAVEEYGVVISNSNHFQYNLITTKYYIPDRIYEKLISTKSSFDPNIVDPFAPEKKAGTNREQSITGAIETRGITFPKGARARYEKIENAIYFTNTRDQADLFDALLSMLDDDKIILGPNSRFHK